MPSLEIEIEMVTPTNDNPGGTNAKFYVSDHDHVGANGEFYYGFIQKSPSLKLQDTGSGEIQMSGASITFSNEPQNAKHPFGSVNYTKILSDTGPYFIGIKYKSVYNLFEGQLFIQTIDSESISCSIKSIRSGDATPGIPDGQETAGNGEIVPLAYGSISKSIAVRDDTFASDFDNISGSAVQTVLYFKNTTNTTPTILVNDSSSTWAATGNIRYSPDTLSDGDSVNNNGLASYQSTNAYAADTAFQFSATGMKNPITLTRTTAGTTFLALSEFIVYSMSRDGRGVATITPDKFYILENNTIDSNKTGTSPTIGIMIETSQGDKLSINFLRESSLSVNYQFYILPSQTDGDRTLTIIDKANIPSTSSAYYKAISENDVLNLVIRGPQEIRRIKGEFTYYDSFGSANLRELTISKEVVLDTTGKDFKFGASITGIDQVSNLTNVLSGIKTFYQKATINAEINDLHDEWRPGDRVVFNRRDEFVNVDMIIRSIEWNFTDLTTVIEGDATLTPYVQE